MLKQHGTQRRKVYVALGGQTLRTMEFARSIELSPGEMVWKR